MHPRLPAIQQALRNNDIDVLALTPGATMRYITGFHFAPTDRLLLLLVPANDTPIAVLPTFEESNWRGNVLFDTHIFPWDDTQGPVDAVTAALGRIPASKTVAVEPLVMRVMEHDLLRAHLPKTSFVSADTVVQPLRLHKHSDEIESIRKAARIGEQTLNELLPRIQPGTTETEIASWLSSGLLGNGGDGISFGPIVLSGPKSALPHGVPDSRAVQRGELLLLDFGTSYEGYHCDITRTFVVGADPDETTRRVYNAVLEGNERGRAACKPGATCHEIHHAAQDHFADPRFAKYMKHRTGHGLGLEVHEPPSIMDGNHAPVAVGNVFTVEPGLYLDGWGGVRIEDDVIITATGAESITTFPRDLRVIG